MNDWTFLDIFWYPQETAFDRKSSVRLNFRSYLLDMGERLFSICAKLQDLCGVFVCSVLKQALSHITFYGIKLAL